MRRVEPAFPDLFPVTHLVRPGYLPGRRVSLDPVRMGIVWDDAPRRILPAGENVPRQAVCCLAFARVARERPTVIERLAERGSSLLLVLDDPKLKPEDVGVNGDPDDLTVTVLLPVLPSPLSDDFQPSAHWQDHRWGAVMGLFPFPGAEGEIETRLEQIKRAGASFATAAPLLLTPKDRHRILDGCEGSGLEDRLENCLFHADVSRGLHALERRAGVTLQRLGMEPVIPWGQADGVHPNATRTVALMRLWARRLDQTHEESSWGWRLRRAASALQHLTQDPMELAEADNLRVVPGFDPWVESFTRSLWNGGEPVESAWLSWSGQA
jgi:hypothetical protein